MLNCQKRGARLVTYRRHHHRKTCRYGELLSVGSAHVQVTSLYTHKYPTTKEDEKHHVAEPSPLSSCHVVHLCERIAQQCACIRHCLLLWWTQRKVAQHVFYVSTANATLSFASKRRLTKLSRSFVPSLTSLPIPIVIPFNILTRSLSPCNLSSFPSSSCSANLESLERGHHFDADDADDWASLPGRGKRSSSFLACHGEEDDVPGADDEDAPQTGVEEEGVEAPEPYGCSNGEGARRCCCCCCCAKDGEMPDAGGWAYPYAESMAWRSDTPPI